MTEFQIEEGEVWAGNMMKRHWHRVSGLTFGSLFQWDLKLDMSECPDGTTIKLCGVAEVPLMRYNRIKRGGWGQLLSFTHEDSDRVIATKKGDEIALKTYAYRQGYGPATSTEGAPIESFSQPICRVDHLEPFRLAIRYNDQIEHQGERLFTYNTSYNVRTIDGNLINSVDVPRWKSDSKLKHRTFAHAKGYKQQSAPAPISISLLNHGLVET